MRKVLTMSVAIIILSSSMAWSFDGARKGFVLGGGAGLASADLEFKGQSVNPSETAGAAHVMIGYGFDNRNMLVLEGSAAVYETLDLNTTLTVTQGWWGIAWYHYFAPAAKSFYTVIGLGAMSYDISRPVPGGTLLSSADPGGGLMFGAGYSFSRHFQVGLHVARGETSVPGFAEFDHVNVSVLLTAVAF